MGNSTKKLQDIVDYARTFAELNPVLAKGGFVQQPALEIANIVMEEMLSPKFNWKWNRFNIPPIFTSSWQQDYAIVQVVNSSTGARDGGASVTNLKWLEHGVVIDVNNTAIPKPIWPLETDRDLEAVSIQYGRPGQVCWLPNDQLRYGVWGAADASTSLLTFGNNPQPLQVITNPLGSPSQPKNPLTQIVDKFGNFLVLTTYGTTGASAPDAGAANAASGTIVNDGTVKWTVVDPKGQGLRLNPIPPQTGILYMLYIVGQMRPPRFGVGSSGTAFFNQTLEPIPDDYSPYFEQGFVAHCWRHSPEAKLRAKFQVEWSLWQKKMVDVTKVGDRERDNAGFYPSRGIMDAWWINYGPAYPYPTY